MSIFPQEIHDSFDNKISEESMNALEEMFQVECRELKIPYTRAYLRAVLYAVQRFVKLGMLEGSPQGFTGGQVSWILHIERILNRFEKKVADKMQSDESIL